MVHSMTGYGKASGKVKGVMVQVEIRSLNSKALELGLRVPQAFKEKEAELRRTLGQQAQRGKIDFTLTSEGAARTGKNVFNDKAIKAYVRELKQITADLKLPNERFLPLALSLPDAVREEKQTITETEWKQVMALVNRALAEFSRFRLQEGRALEKDLVGRLHAIEGMLGELAPHEAGRIDAVRSRLNKQLSQANVQDVDRNRFEQELIYYLERLDITEEKTRLASHCRYFMETIRSRQHNGKKLGFITQEMGREINTIGAKANDAVIQRIVVGMKDELEKMKEQLANVL